MQFTELSELNRVIGMMRMSSCNSPTFHDRQDSEVDRIYNSSPKMEMQLRNSWIDRIAAASVKKTTQSSNSTSTRISKVVSSVSDVPTRIRSSSSASKQANRNTNDSRASGVNTTIGGDGKLSEKSIINTTTKGDSSSTKEVVAEKENDDGFEFAREDVGPCSNHETSLLDTLLKGGASTAVGQKAPMMGTEGGAVLHLTIYLPSRQVMKIGLYDSSTVDESIQEILRTHQGQGQQPTLYYGHPECYELRLHDSDGYPDEDFPALDRSRKIKNFGDAGGHEYCLCERPDTCPPSGDPSHDTANPVIPKNIETVSTMHKALPTTNEKIFLKIFMPRSDDYTVVAVDNNTTGQDLLPTLNKKHRLQLFQDQYVLKISEAERERLDLATDEIDMHTKLRPLNIHEATLATKQYADAPQVPVTVTNTVEDAANVDSRSRPPPETFMFNDVTVAMYKEWHVIKKNKFGKKQHRMLGIDINKVYNRKVGERVIKSRNTTKIAERPISSVEWVRFMQDPSDFQIYFKDHIEEIITDYTADSPYECAEIVAKLKYILSRRKQ